MRKKLVSIALALAILVSPVYSAGGREMDVYAASVYTSTNQITSYLKDLLSDEGNTVAVLRTNFSLSRKTLAKCISEAALANGRAMTVASPAYSYVARGSDYEYRVDVPPSIFTDVVLLSSEANAYKRAIRALRDRDYSTAFYSENNMYYDIFLRAVEQHPEYNYNVTIWRSSNGTCGYRLSDDVSASEVKSQMKKADKKADSIIVSIIKEGMTTSEKYQAIHDYLVKNTVYDIETYDSGGDDWGETYTAYGCLIDRYAVCQGYAAAFNLLCAKAGLSTIAVNGTGKGGSHAWNMVKLGSEYRYVDVTWDDPVPDRGDNVSYKYYMLTADEIGMDHKWLKTKFAVKYVKYSKYAFD